MTEIQQQTSSHTDVLNEIGNFFSLFMQMRGPTVTASPYLYGARNQVERFFNKPKYFRRIATPYDEPGSTCLAMVKLAAIRIRLRVCQSTA